MSETSIELQSKPLECYTERYIEYVKNVRARSSNTVMAYVQDLSCFTKYLDLDNVSDIQLSEECVMSYLKYLRQVQQLKPATVRRRLLTLQGFCRWMVEGKIFRVSPFDDLLLDLKVPKRLPRPVDPLTIRQLVQENRLSENLLELERHDWTSSSRIAQKQTTLLVLQLMLTTGIRVGEVTAIRLQDISSDGKSIHIIGKGNKERLVYIENTRLAEGLSHYIEKRKLNGTVLDSLFLNGRGAMLTPQTIRKRFKAMCRDVGTIDSPTPHRFRHSAATLLIENGVDIRVVQRLLGHASISTTELYTQVTDVSLRDALRKADVLRQFQ